MSDQIGNKLLYKAKTGFFLAQLQIYTDDSEFKSLKYSFS